MNHVSVSPTNGNGPTQGQNYLQINAAKTQAVAIGPSLYAYEFHLNNEKIGTPDTQPRSQDLFPGLAGKKSWERGWPDTEMQRWRGGESTRFPPMWHGFDSRVGVICGLGLAVLFSAEVFLRAGTPVCPSLQKPPFDLICVYCNFILRCPQLVLQR